MAKADLHVKLAGGQQVVGGYSLAPYTGGNMGTGTITFDPLLGNYQYWTNSGAVAIQVPTVDCAMDILIINSGTAGAITFGAGWIVGTTGEVFNTVLSHRFILSIRRIAGIPTYIIKALQ